MPTRDDLLNPDKTPITGWLRWLDRPKTADFPALPGLSKGLDRETVLQRYVADRGAWEDVPLVTQEELDAASIK